MISSIIPIKPNEKQHEAKTCTYRCRPFIIFAAGTTPRIRLTAFAIFRVPALFTDITSNPLYCDDVFIAGAFVRKSLIKPYGVYSHKSIPVYHATKVASCFQLVRSKRVTRIKLIHYRFFMPVYHLLQSIKDTDRICIVSIPQIIFIQPKIRQ